MTPSNILVRQHGLFLSLAGFLVTATVAAGTPAPITKCESAPAVLTGGGTSLGMVWSGVNTGIGAATDANGTLLAAYYAADRYVTLASLNSKTGRLCHRRLASQFGGWDAHNSLAIAIAEDGTIHIAGNAHASALLYARGKSSDIGSVRIMAMTGHDERTATYPRFLFDGARNLFFLYRDGQPGGGRWLINRWNGKSWQRMDELFSSRDTKGPVSAYPSDFVKGPDGRFHVAVVWRRTPDVSSNFAVTYASTTDFQTWTTAGRHSVNGPLTPQTMETVDASGEGAGLVNNVSLALSGSGKPVILYTRYGTGGFNSIFVATQNVHGWTSKPIAAARARKEISGTGALPGLPIASFGNNLGTTVEVNVTFSTTDTKRLVLDFTTIATTPNETNINAAKNGVATFLKGQTKGMADVGTPSAIVRDNGVDGPITGNLRWFAQKANADRPRTCTPDTPTACNPPASPLLWFPAPTTE